MGMPREIGPTSFALYAVQEEGCGNCYAKVAERH